MVGLGRWKTAQRYEQGYWAGQAAQIAAGATSQLSWYQWRSDQLIKRLRRCGFDALTGGEATVLEVGGGPVGVASFFPSYRAVLVDPLESFYGSNEVLRKLRNPRAEYVSGRGEALPVESGAFDLVIIENCIDHVQDAWGVMQELGRALRPDGVLYLTVNCRSNWGYVVHRTLSSLRLDPGHPHTFTPPRVAGMLRRHGFEPVDTEVGSYEDAYREDKQSPSRKARLKALLGVSEFVTSAISRKAGLVADHAGRVKDEASVA
jgi:SAM-dependent methyltransferase